MLFEVVGWSWFMHATKAVIIDYLLTECEVRMRKYLHEVFLQIERRWSEVCAKKIRGKILSRTNRTNEVNKKFIIWLLAHFFITFNEALCL